jgi:hypothetical protein
LADARLYPEAEEDFMVGRHYANSVPALVAVAGRSSNTPTQRRLSQTAPFPLLV